MLTALAAFTVSSASAGSYYVWQVGPKAYAVYNANTGKTVYVRDYQAYLKARQEADRIDGFGSALTAKEFAEGATPVADAVESAARPVGYVAGTAYNVANMTPSWRKYTIPLKAVLGTRKTQQQKPRNSGFGL